MRTLGLVVIFATLSGCAFRPTLPDNATAPTSLIVDLVECELKAAYDEQVKLKQSEWLKYWAAAFELTLRVDDTNGVGVSTIDWAIPVGYSLGGAAGVSQRNSSIATLKFTVALNSLKTQTDCVSRERERPAIGMFREGLGIREWLYRASTSFDAKDTSPMPDSFGFTTEFYVSASGELKPGFSIVGLSGAAGASARREDTHTLAMTFADNRPKPTMHVIVDNMPAKIESERPAKTSQTTRETRGSRVYRGTVNPQVQMQLNNDLQSLQLRQLLGPRFNSR